jgi:Ser/Thr protein kinase RdoA (MazF antagonist)
MSETVQAPFAVDSGGRRPLAAPEDQAILAEVADRYGCEEARLASDGANRVYLLNPTDYFPTHVLKRFADPGPDERQADNLAAETAALTVLAEQPDPPLATPQLLEHDPRRRFYVATALEGMSENNLLFTASVPPKAKQQIGRQLGAYVAWFAGIDRERYAEALGGRAVPSMYWDDVVSKYIDGFEDTKYPVLSHLSRSIYQELTTLYPNGIDAVQEQLIHSDFRADNALFKYDAVLPRMSGAIDFEYVVLGGPEAAMRGFRTRDELVVASAAEAFEQQTGRPINLRKVRAMAVAQTLLAANSQITHGVPLLKWFFFAQHRLMDAFPDEDWKELYGAISENYAPPTGEWHDESWEGAYGDTAPRRRSDMPTRRLPDGLMTQLMLCANIYDDTPAGRIRAA